MYKPDVLTPFPLTRLSQFWLNVTNSSIDNKDIILIDIFSTREKVSNHESEPRTSGLNCERSFYWATWAERLEYRKTADTIYSKTFLAIASGILSERAQHNKQKVMELH